MRKCLLAAWLTALVFGGLLAVCLRLPRYTITKETCEAIEVGMPIAEVERILGGPPACAHRGRYRKPYAAGGIRIPGVTPEPRVWNGKDYGVSLYVGPDGLVTSIERYEVFHQEPMPPEDSTFLSHAHWRIRGWFGFYF